MKNPGWGRKWGALAVTAVLEDVVVVVGVGITVAGERSRVLVATLQIRQGGKLKQEVVDCCLLADPVLGAARPVSFAVPTAEGVGAWVQKHWEGYPALSQNEEVQKK